MGRDLLGELEHQVLLAVLRLREDAYTAPIVTELEERTGRPTTLAAVYIVLRRLEEKGLVRSELREGGEGSRERRYFAVTPEGMERVLDARAGLRAPLGGARGAAGGTGVSAPREAARPTRWLDASSGSSRGRARARARRSWWRCTGRVSSATARARPTGGSDGRCSRSSPPRSAGARARPGTCAAGSAVDVRRAARALVRAPALERGMVLTLGLGIGAARWSSRSWTACCCAGCPSRIPSGWCGVWDGMSRGELGEIRARSGALVDARGYVDGGAGVNLEHDGEAFRAGRPRSSSRACSTCSGPARCSGGCSFRRRPSRAAGTRDDPRRGAVARDVRRRPRGDRATITLDGRPYAGGGRPSRETGTFPDPADRLWIPLDWNPTQPGPFWGSGGVQVVGRLARARRPRRRRPSCAPSRRDRGGQPGVDARGGLPGAGRGDAAPRGPRQGRAHTLLGAPGRGRRPAPRGVRQRLVAAGGARARAGPDGGRAHRARRERGRVAREALAESVLLGLDGALLGVAGAPRRPGAAPPLPGRAPAARRGAARGRYASSLVVGGGRLGRRRRAGVVPARRAARRDPGQVLRYGRAGRGSGRAAPVCERPLVGAQVAAAVVLVVPARSPGAHPRGTRRPWTRASARTD